MYSFKTVKTIFLFSLFLSSCLCELRCSEHTLSEEERLKGIIIEFLEKEKKTLTQEIIQLLEKGKRVSTQEEIVQLKVSQQRNELYKDLYHDFIYVMEHQIETARLTFIFMTILTVGTPLIYKLCKKFYKKYKKKQKNIETENELLFLPAKSASSIGA